MVWSTHLHMDGRSGQWGGGDVCACDGEGQICVRASLFEEIDSDKEAHYTGCHQINMRQLYQAASLLTDEKRISARLGS